MSRSEKIRKSFNVLSVVASSMYLKNEIEFSTSWKYIFSFQFLIKYYIIIKIYYRCRSRTGSRPEVFRYRRGGKSELQRARCSVTRSPGNGKESATERETTALGCRGKGEKVSASGGFRPRVWPEGKSSPVSRVTGTAWKTPPGARPNRFRIEGPPQIPVLAGRRNG